MRRWAGALLVVLGSGLVLSSAAAAEPEWTMQHPAPPPGAPFPVPLGKPTDIQFFAPNRGLLAVEGNAAIPAGLFIWNGKQWRQLSTVCGRADEGARVAWAGPREFWTTTEPASLPGAINRETKAVSLCHFRDGAVVASYAVPSAAADPYFPMSAATCNSPDDCWFGGLQQQDPSGARVGAFHLHWDGSAVSTVYAPQGRAVSDLEAHQGGVIESVHVGARATGGTSPVLRDPEPKPRLLHRIVGLDFFNDPFVPLTHSDGQTALFSLDSDGSQAWAGGGDASSGPDAPETPTRRPIAARMESGSFTEVPLDPAGFAAGERFTDIAAVPDTNTAWAVIDTPGDDGYADVALISSSGDVLRRDRLPASGPPRGEAARIACTSSGDCWLATAQGWLFRYSDGVPQSLDADPAFSGLIEFRPPDGRTPQAQPDSNPIDDSLRFQSPPVEVQATTQQETSEKTLGPLLKGVRSKLRGSILSISFRLTRRARIGLVARRKRKVVARTKRRVLRPGKHVIRLRLDLRRPPTSVRFAATDLEAPSDGGDSDQITTGGPTIARTERR